MNHVRPTRPLRQGTQRVRGHLRVPQRDYSHRCTWRGLSALDGPSKLDASHCGYFCRSRHLTTRAKPGGAARPIIVPSGIQIRSELSLSLARTGCPQMQGDFFRSLSPSTGCLAPAFGAMPLLVGVSRPRPIPMSIQPLQRRNIKFQKTMIDRAQRVIVRKGKLCLSLLRIRCKTPVQA
jgi:hypothetical protein